MSSIEQLDLVRKKNSSGDWKYGEVRNGRVAWHSPEDTDTEEEFPADLDLNTLLFSKHFNYREQVAFEDVETIEDVEKIASVLIKGTGGAVLPEINSKRLENILPFYKHDFLLFEKNLGKVTSVDLRIVLENSKNKEKFEVSIKRFDESSSLEPFKRDTLFYPGQEIKANSKQLNWLLRNAESPENSNSDFTVISVNIPGIYIKWLENIGFSKQEPRGYVAECNFRKIERISAFEHKNIRIGAIKRLKVLSTDYGVKLKDWKIKDNFQEDEKFYVDKDNSHFVYVEVLNYKTYVDLQCLNGGVLKKIPSKDLKRASLLFDIPPNWIEFSPRGIVSNKFANKCDIYKIFGLVQSVDNQNKLAIVNWNSFNIKWEVESESKEENSVYNLVESENYNFRPGELVQIKSFNFGVKSQVGYYHSNFGDFKAKIILPDKSEKIVLAFNLQKLLINYEKNEKKEKELVHVPEKGFEEKAYDAIRDTMTILNVLGEMKIDKTRTNWSFIKNVLPPGMAGKQDFSKFKTLEDLNRGVLMPSISETLKISGLMYSYWDMDEFNLKNYIEGVFCHVFNNEPNNHKFFNYPKAIFEETYLLKDKIKQSFTEMIKKKNMEILCIKAYGNRIDLYSVLISGPFGTIYDNNIFFFDLHVDKNFPISPPKIAYVSISPEIDINPFLDHQNGKIYNLNILEPEIWSCVQNKGFHAIFKYIFENILIANPYDLLPKRDESEDSEEVKNEKRRSYNEDIFVGIVDISIKIAHPFKLDFYFNYWKNELKMLNEHYFKIHHEFLIKCNSEQTTPVHNDVKLIPFSKSAKMAIQERVNLLEEMIKNVKSNIYY